MTRYLESASSKSMSNSVQSEDGSALIEFVLTAIPVFAASQLVFTLLGIYGSTFIDARTAIFESAQLAMADRDNRLIVGYSTACQAGSSQLLLPKTCWHTKLEPTL
jgi:hypothetical protein